MSAKTARAEKKAQTRDALRAAARALFSDRGFAATQVGDIAKAAGVAHGTFYVHYPSKEQLLDELLSEHNEALVRKLGRDWPTTAPEQIVSKLAGICLDHWRGDRQLVLAFAQRAGLDGDVGTLLLGINPQVSNLLAARLAEIAGATGGAQVDTELTAQALMGMWQRVAMHHLFGGVSRAQAVETLTALSVGALRAAIPGLGPSK